MAKLDFAFWDGVSMAELAKAPTADVYQRHLRLAQNIEQLGYHSYFVIEHQNAGPITSPSLWLGTIAAQTSVLRVGAMIWQLPFHNPVRLAEEVAMLDQLSKGRVEFGTGIGVHEHEFIRWNINFYERRQMAGEAMEIILKAFTEEEVTYKGKYWTFDEALPQPRPYQKPYPPIWVAAHTNASMEYAAERNFHVSQNIDIDDNAAKFFDHYREVWPRYGHAGPMPRFFLQRNVHVAETDAKAREEAEQFIVGRRTVGAAAPEEREAVSAGAVRSIDQTRIGWGSSRRGMGTESDITENAERGRVFSESAKSYEFSIENGLALVGSPDTVTRKLEEVQKRMGLSIFAGVHQIGGMSMELTEKSVDLFGKHVIPNFK